MKFKVLTMKNPVTKEIRYSPQPVKLGAKNTRDIADEIAGRCS